jgi:hypothetical protein
MKSSHRPHSHRYCSRRHNRVCRQNRSLSGGSASLNRRWSQVRQVRKPSIHLGPQEVISYGNNRSPVSASSTMMALTGQFSAASRIFSTVSPSGLTASDCRFAFSTNTFGAMVSHMALPTQTLWSTHTRTFLAMIAPLIPDHGR